MNKLSKGINDLATCYPDIAKEWDYLKNDKPPTEYTQYSNKSVWWLCSKGHSYQRRINDRTRQNQGCPYCSHHKVLTGFNDFATVHSDLLPEWDFKKNDISPYEITANNGKEIWWLCQKGHSYHASISHRVTMKSGCPYCAGKKVLVGFNDLKTLHPEIVEEWNYEKNGDLKPENFTYGSNKSVWWKCKFCEREWKTAISHRTIEHTSCPTCKKLSKGEEIIAKELDNEGIKYIRQKTFDDCKNHFLLPFDFYLPDYNILIEYDGRQHFEPVDIFGGEKEFKKQKERDETKNQYTENNNIVLIRISYKNLTKMKRTMKKVIEICKMIQ